MVNFSRVLLVVFFVFLIIPAIQVASAHSPLNSESEAIGKYEVQIATDPEIPAANQPFKLQFRVLNYEASTFLNSFNTAQTEVDHFRMGARIYYNGELVDTILPQLHQGGEWSTNYVFHESGNHVVEVDLYDAGTNGETITYTFNVTALNIFGPLFVYVISAGGFGCFVLLIWILITKKRTKSKP